MRPIPRPSWRMYTRTPRPSRSMMASALWSCEPQSHLREGEEIRHPRHPPFVVQHLADHSGGGAPGEAGQVDGGLGMPRPAQDAAGHRAERKDVARAGEVVRA